MAKYRVETDGGTFEVETDEGAVPGMEKLGGQPPAAGKPPVDVQLVSRAAALGLGSDIPESAKPKPGEPYLGNANDVAGVGLGRLAEAAVSGVRSAIPIAGKVIGNKGVRDAVLEAIPGFRTGRRALTAVQAIRQALESDPEAFSSIPTGPANSPAASGVNVPLRPPIASSAGLPPRGVTAAPANAPPMAAAEPQLPVAPSASAGSTPTPQAPAVPTTGPLANNPKAMSIAKALRDSLEANQTGVDKEAEAVANTARAENATAKIAGSRITWADTMAKTLHKSGITASDASEYIKTPGQLDHMARVAGVSPASARSATTLNSMVDSLKSLESAQPVASEAIQVEPLSRASYPHMSAKNEPIALLRDVVPKLMEEGAVTEDGGRMVEVMGRKATMSEPEIREIVMEAQRQSGGPATGKAIADIYKSKLATEQNKAIQKELADYRLEHMADDFKPGGKYHKGTAK